jgi:alkyl sulfatase BDS1-like metallo-beta-lactamase superfamily hydrolase
MRLAWIVVAALSGLIALGGCSREESTRPALRSSSDDGSGHSAPSEFTLRANAAVLDVLPFEDQRDFELAKRGFIASLDDPVIRDANGKVIWDTRDFDFVEGDPPGSVNPSLWRQAKLNGIHGLFKVSDRIYQVRGYDLANMSLIEGDTGWIVIDPLTTQETAEAAMGLVAKHLGVRPVVALIFTHSHIDHFGGARGVLSDADLERGVPVIAPEGFVIEAVSENVLAGTAMSRRASYMFGFLLNRSARGHVDSGLGKATAAGTFGLIRPSEIVSGEGRSMTLDGVEVYFQNTPGAEAPAEMMPWFPGLGALCGAENVSHVLHNLYTLRGAKVRDALRWSNYLDQAIERAGDIDVLFASHHWPTWGNGEIIEYLKKQRDVYKFIHDQTLRLANQGMTMVEIAEQIRLPESLAQTFATRGYYGTVNHNAKAVYQFYFGWYDGNPANLNPLPPEAEATRYVDAMGGASALLEKARASFDAGEYRWTATLLNHLVFAQPDNDAARSLLAETYDQLGYQAESGPWRDFYLSGAKELREGAIEMAIARTGPIDVVSSMPTGLFFDALAVRLNAEKAEGADSVINFVFEDIGETHVVNLENAVLHHRSGAPRADADATVRLTRELWNRVVSKQTSFQKELLKGNVDVDGSPLALVRFFAMLDDPSPTFNIVTP